MTGLKNRNRKVSKQKTSHLKETGEEVKSLTVPV
jgi:hypothetical protein